jgi:hypothetical protein
MIPKPFTRVVISYGPMSKVSATAARDAAQEAERFQTIMEDAERVATTAA